VIGQLDQVKDQLDQVTDQQGQVTGSVRSGDRSARSCNMQVSWREPQARVAGKFRPPEQGQVTSVRIDHVWSDQILRAGGQVRSYQQVSVRCLDFKRCTFHCIQQHSC
jgi:hypothetical protein